MNDKLIDKGLLPLEELIKALDEKGIEYDRGQYFPTFCVITINHNALRTWESQN